MACTSPADPAATANTISLSVPNVTLAPGEARTVQVSVQRQGGRVRLTVGGAPPGVTAVLASELLEENESATQLAIAADAQAPAGASTLAVSAITSGSASASSAAATLDVRVCPGYAIPTSCPPFPTGGSRMIAGRVLEKTATGVRPLAGASVWAWVQTPTYGYSRGQVMSDADGNYRIDQLPEARILLQASTGRHDQSCGTVVDLAGSPVYADLELTRRDAPLYTPQPAPPGLAGVVYESGAAGRTPVAGARVFYETGMEIVGATSTTDSLGRYSLCRLPLLTAAGFVTPVKDGYVGTGVIVEPSGVTQLDLEMRRR